MSWGNLKDQETISGNPDRGQATPTIQVQPTVAKGIATGFSVAISYCC